MRQVKEKERTSKRKMYLRKNNNNDKGLPEIDRRKEKKQWLTNKCFLFHATKVNDCLRQK